MPEIRALLITSSYASRPRLPVTAFYKLLIFFVYKFVFDLNFTKTIAQKQIY